MQKMAESAKDRAIAALFDGIDVDDAEKQLRELELPLEYSDAAVRTLNSETDKIASQAAKLKRAESPRAERKALRERVDRLVNARALLYRLRPAQPGDVTVEPGPVGGDR